MPRDRRRSILGPPNAEAHKHYIEAAEALQKAEAALVKSDFEKRMSSLPEDVNLTFKRSIENRFRDELWEAANKHRLTIKELNKEFHARWFVWRAALPISIISGMTGEEMFAGLDFFEERSMAIWIARETGGVSWNHLSRVVDRDRSSVISSFRRADVGIRDRDPAFINLFESVLQLEEEVLCHLRR